jgi:hypothetical protein
MAMTQALFLKNLPAPLQFWIRPMLLASLSVHGLVLAIPTHSEKKPAPAIKKEPEKVKITQLPTSTSVPAPKVSPIAAIKPSPLVAQAKPTPVIPKLIRPPSITPPIPPITTISRPKPQPVATPLTPTATPSVATASPSTPAPSVATASPSTPAPAAPSTPLPSPPSQDPFADFPIYPNATAGSSGLLTGDADKAARTVKADLATVVAYYKAELPKRQFDPKPATPDETDLKVFPVAKGGVSQYLHLKNTGDNTIIVLAPQPLDLKNLANLEVEPPEAREFQTVLGQLVNVDVLPAIGLGDLQDVAAFQGGNVKSLLGEFKEITPQALGSTLEQGLRGAGFEVSPISTSFGGGILYQIKKGAYIGYLSLAPTKTPSRTGIITLKKSPLQ